MLALTSEQKHKFFHDGYLLFPKLFRSDEMDRIDEAFQRLQAIAKKLTSPQVLGGAYYVVNDHRIDRIVWCGAAEPSLLDFSADPRLTHPSSELLGSKEMSQLICQAHFKLPEDGVGFGWHQDSEHRRYGTPEWRDANGKGSFIQTIMAVDDMAEDNGPLLMVSGTGLVGHLGLNSKTDEENAKYDSLAKPMIMERGSVLFFGPYTVHGSQPNKSQRPRRVFINGYAHPEANTRVYPGEGSGRKLVVR